MKNAVDIRFQGGPRPWRIYWSSTLKLADKGRYATIEDAGRAARAIVFPAPKPKLEVVGC